MISRAQFEQLKAWAQHDVVARLARGGAWLTINQCLVRLLNFGTNAIIVRLTGAHGFGEYVATTQTAQFFATFAQLGLGAATTRQVSHHYQMEPRMAVLFVKASALFTAGSASLLALIFLLFSHRLSLWLLGTGELAFPLQLSAVAMVFMATNAVQIAVLTGTGSFGAIARLTSVQSVASFLSFVTGAYFWGMTGAVAAFTFNAVFVWILYRVFIRTEMPLLAEVKWSEISKPIMVALWKLGLPIMAAGLVSSSARWGIVSLLAHSKDGLHSVGNWQVALNLVSLMLLIPDITTSACSPILGNLLGTNRRAGARKLVFAMVAGLLGVSVLIGLAGYGLRGFLLSIYGTKTAESLQLMALMCCSVPAVCLFNFFIQAMVNLGLVRIRFWGNVLWAVVLISGGAFALQIDWGVWGVGSAYLTAYILATLLVGSCVLRKI